MKLQIDNLDGNGPRDYTTTIDASKPPRVIRKLNQAAELRVSLVADAPDFVVPVNGARVTLGRTDGQDVFTGYLMAVPVFQYLGWGERGPVYRYDLIARSDEAVLDRKRLPYRSPFVDRSAGDALRQLTQDLLPGFLDASAVQNADMLASYAPDPQKKWSEHAAEIALQARASYRTSSGALILSPVGARTHTLNETDRDFSPEGLILQSMDAPVNDVTVIGELEPQAYVKDYFVGDGLTLNFYLSQTPFTKRNRTLLSEEYTTSVLDPTRWSVTDPESVVSVGSGKLQIAGGTGADGQTVVSFAEKIELGGALVLQHGDVTFSAPSDGVLGGLYPNAISTAACLAGFRLTTAGAQSNIQALVSGALTGPVINTAAGHHYFFTTRFYALEIYRRQQTYHSSLHPAGNGLGGATVAADVRVVLEVHDIDPANPATLVAPSTVLYDGVIAAAPDFCTYAPVNARNLQCAIAFTRLVQAVDAEVRSALPGQSYRTRLVGVLSDGAECNITPNATLAFFQAYVPASNELVAVHYRGRGRALARVTDPASIATQQQGLDNGLHGAVWRVKAPPARTAADCENAALALLDDATGAAWLGEYDTWSDFLPGNAQDIFPGDALNVNVPSRGAVFQTVVREVDLTVRDLQEEHSSYRITFANDAAQSLGFEFEAARISTSLIVTEVTDAQVGTLFLSDLTAAEITQVSSTSVNVDAGVAPPAGGGIEVRWSDAGWGPDNDRNLVGRFVTQTFALPRLARTQNYFLRKFDASVPPKYSRYSTALHLDYPL